MIYSDIDNLELAFHKVTISVANIIVFTKQTISFCNDISYNYYLSVNYIINYRSSGSCIAYSGDWG